MYTIQELLVDLTCCKYIYYIMYTIQELLVDLTYCTYENNLYCERHYAERLGIFSNLFTKNNGQLRLQTTNGESSLKN